MAPLNRCVREVNRRRRRTGSSTRLNIVALIRFSVIFFRFAAAGAAARPAALRPLQRTSVGASAQRNRGVGACTGRARVQPPTVASQPACGMPHCCPWHRAAPPCAPGLGLSAGPEWERGLVDREEPSGSGESQSGLTREPRAAVRTTLQSRTAATPARARRPSGSRRGRACRCISRPTQHDAATERSGARGVRFGSTRGHGVQGSRVLEGTPGRVLYHAGYCSALGAHRAAQGIGGCGVGLPARMALTLPYRVVQRALPADERDRRADDDHDEPDRREQQHPEEPAPHA